MTWIKKLHWQIVISLGLGLIYGIIATRFGWFEFTSDWITPFGTIFINLLKLCAVPLVIVSLICGVASLSDTSKLSRLGGKTILAYMATTAIAITIGLLVANIINPGKGLDAGVAEKLMASSAQHTVEIQNSAKEVMQDGPLKPVIDIIPDNFFASVSNNRNMLQIVFLSIFFGITLILIPRKNSRPVIDFFNGLNECLITAVKLVIKMAPVGVFALLASAITSSGGEIGALLSSLGTYGLTVVIALLLHAGLVYTSIVHFLTPFSVKQFFKAIWPAQTFAFSTSSSAATLPITMDRCHNELKIPRENCSFILPLGATINMDGTALYQAVAAIFLSNAIGEPLSFGGQLTIIMIALLASIGTAAVPSAGMVMLVVILEQLKIPAEAIGLIWALDRPLDMLRTAVNVTGDAAVASYVSADDIPDDLDYGGSSPGNRNERRRPPRRRPRQNQNNRGNRDGGGQNQKDGNSQGRKDGRPSGGKSQPSGNQNQRRRRPNQNKDASTGSTQKSPGTKRPSQIRSQKPSDDS